MFVSSVIADAFGTNCYLVAAGEGERCLVVDPGVGVAERVEALLRRHRLTPAAILLTHGHVDHCFAVAPLSRAHGVAVAVHPRDRYRLDDPYAGLDAQLAALLSAQAGPWQPPRDLLVLDEGEHVVSLADLDVRVVPAPGHTEGSVMFGLDGAPATSGDAVLEATLLSGDVLFAGSVGRTDLPGGDDAAMRRTLRDVVLAQDDATLVLPGHGPATTLAVERRRNPYLAEAHLGAGV